MAVEGRVLDRLSALRPERKRLQEDASRRDSYVVIKIGYPWLEGPRGVAAVRTPFKTFRKSSGKICSNLSIADANQDSACCNHSGEDSELQPVRYSGSPWLLPAVDFHAERASVQHYPTHHHSVEAGHWFRVGKSRQPIWPIPSRAGRSDQEV